jgi:hypothetical protein
MGKGPSLNITIKEEPINILINEEEMRSLI